MQYVFDMASDCEREINLFRQHGGLLRMSAAVRIGISRNKLYAMRADGVVEHLSRGLYRLASLEPMSEPDLATIALRVPRGVLCLVSALSFHNLTTQIPKAMDVALERGTRVPRITYPPTQFHWFSGESFHSGIEEYQTDGFVVRVYDPEKTVVDCFRFRNQIGVDVALEALKSWNETRRWKRDAIVRYAHARRVERAMRPYLEAIT